MRPQTVLNMSVCVCVFCFGRGTLSNIPNIHFDSKGGVKTVLSPRHPGFIKELPPSTCHWPGGVDVHSSSDWGKTSEMK